VGGASNPPGCARTQTGRLLGLKVRLYVPRTFTLPFLKVAVFW